jgi:hypothetical protein
MANAAISGVAGGTAGISSAAFNYQMCKDAEVFRHFSQQCSGAFGPLSHWAATNPEVAALLVGVTGFALAQGAQTLVGKFFDW